MEFNGTFFVSIISFLVFVFLMNKILYVPMQKIVAERNKFIDDNYQIADENNQQAEKLSSERDKKLVVAKDDARVKYNELLSGYKEKRNDIIKSAQDSAQTKLVQEYESLNNVSNQAKEALKWKMTDLANDIVEKVLGYRSEVQGFDNDKIDRILYNQKG